MITEDYVSFEIAKLLKEKGFDEPTTKSYYTEGFENPMKFSHDLLPCIRPDEFLCPTLQMAMKWLREVHKIQLWAEPYEYEKGQYNAYVRVKWFIHQWQGAGYKSNAEACEAAIKYCLENLI